ncbi:hypothetical protein ACIGB8_28745 [Promicromonospora sukumoe]|uniref:hypothetical protein n=1 Tax=Promicromonospora sukumoe TaxID=88382 RepID=UPI0037C9666A
MTTVFGRNWIGLGNEDGSRQGTQKGEVRPTGKGLFQAYDNAGRKLGAPQDSEHLAANTGANEVSRPGSTSTRWHGLW